MQKILFILAVLLFNPVYGQLNIVSILDGSFSDSSVWDCNCIPLNGDSVIINNDLYLVSDLSFSDGSIIIGTGGYLHGPYIMTLSDSFYFENNGILNVKMADFSCSSAVNNGDFSSDSLYLKINNNFGFINNAYMDILTRITNTGRFYIGDTGAVSVEYVVNGDTLIPGMDAVIVNNGEISNYFDFVNFDTLRGDGFLCNFHDSYNYGVVDGTMQICDQTGSGGFDYNWGTITGTVQTCFTTCHIGLNENSNIIVLAYPNPTNSFIQITTDIETLLFIYDGLGKMIYNTTMSTMNHNISVLDWPNGVYFYRIYGKSAQYFGKFMKQSN